MRAFVNEILRGLAILILMFVASSACAEWLGDTKYYVAFSGEVAGVIDSGTGQVWRAFPRNPAMRGAYMKALPAAEPAAGWTPVLPMTPLVVSAPHGQRISIGLDAANVWNVPGNVLERRYPKSITLGFLGPEGNRVAILRQRNAKQRVFEIRELPSDKLLQRRFILGRTRGFSALSLNSTRFVGFTTQDEVWLWDERKQELERLDLPPGLFVTAAMLRPEREDRLVLSGTEALAFDTETLRPLQRYRTTGKVLGWSGDGRYLLVREREHIVQFHASSGGEVHRWSDTPPPRTPGNTLRSLASLLSGETKPSRRANRGGQPVSAAAQGWVLLLYPRWNRIVVWDANQVPPARRPDLCDVDKCGDLAWTPAFDISHNGLMAALQQKDRVTMLRLASAATLELDFDFEALKTALRSARVPEMAPERCDWAPDVCGKDAEQTLAAASLCGTKDGACDARDRAAASMFAACVLGERNLCNNLRNLGRRQHDIKMERTGEAGWCDPLREKETANRECPHALPDPDVAEVRERKSACHEDERTCALQAKALGYSANARIDGLELAQFGCERGYREACLIGGDLALAAGRAPLASDLYRLACEMDNSAECAERMSAASRNTPSTKEERRARDPTPPVPAPELCNTWVHGRIAGVAEFDNGTFIGIRLTNVVNGRGGRLPFEPGDLLRNTIRCKGTACNAERFFSEVARLCGIDNGKLLHDLVLEVDSAVPQRNRAYLLKAAKP